MKKIILSLILLSLFSSVVFAKAYFAGRREMIERAEAIAIVEIVETEEVEQKGNHWIYRQKAMGIVKESLKGDIQGNIVIYGMEDFICAQCRFEKGPFLLFLRKDNSLWVSSNWQVGIRPIKDDKVDWLKNDSSPFETEQKPLKEVILEIKNILKENNAQELKVYLYLVTDKRQYRNGEQVSVTLKNVSDVSLWLEPLCGTFSLLKKEGELWKIYGPYPTKSCLSPPMKLEPKEEKVFDINLQNVYFSGTKSRLIPGVYKLRVRYSFSEPMLGAKIKYWEADSNEFTISRW